MIMRHVAMQPTETTSDVTCDACCQSTSIETALQSLERQLVSLRLIATMGGKLRLAAFSPELARTHALNERRWGLRAWLPGQRACPRNGCLSLWFLDRKSTRLNSSH